MDKMRARGKRWETVKGWSSFNASGMTSGIARGIHAYADLDGNNVLIAASASAVNAWMGGTRIDITPKWADVWLHQLVYQRHFRHDGNVQVVRLPALHRHLHGRTA